MNFKLISYSRLCGDQLSTIQMMVFHYLKSRNTNEFSAKLEKHFLASLESKEDHIIELISQIDDFSNGILYRKACKRPFMTLIKPLNYTMKPFLASKPLDTMSSLNSQKPRGSKSLITILDDDDKAFFQKLKNSLLCILAKIN